MCCTCRPIRCCPTWWCIVRRSPSTCVEPVSHVADGFNLAARGIDGTGTVWLPAGGELQGQLRLSLSPPPSDPVRRASP